MTKHLTQLGTATLCAIALSAVVGVRLAHAAAGDIYNLGTFGGTSSNGSDINDAGQVVGNAQDAAGRSRAFLWDSSRGMTDLGTVNGTEAYAYAINASGSVAGGKYDAGIFHAFAWTPNEPNGTTGSMTNLTLQEGQFSYAADINAAGVVVGASIYSYSYFVDDGSCTPDNTNYPNCTCCWVGGTEYSSVLWENGVRSNLTNSSADGANEWAGAINNAGQVAVNSAGHAFRYDGTPGSGVRHDLGTLGGSVSDGRGINDSGQVVGGSSIAGDTAGHAYRYTGTPGAGGFMVDLGTLGGASSLALDINDAGFVVGFADRTPGAGGGSWATLWQNDAGNTAVDLDAWLDAINPTLGAYWALTEAWGINNNGLIAGTGNYDDGPGGLSDGSRAFVLDASSLLSAIPGDYNGNGTVGPEDYSLWKANFGSTTILATDGNRDGTVNAADYTVWRDNLGQTFTLTNENPAAATLGVVDQEDYDFWKANFGQFISSGASVNVAVPEPSSLLLFILAAASWRLRRHSTE